MPNLQIRPFNLREADWRHDQSVLSNIRRIVFIVEQNVPKEEEWDGLDADSWHWMATDPTDHAIGTARLLPSGQIGRMAVLKEFRGLKVGQAMLEAAVEKARQLGFASVFLNAQTHALDFYKKAGFVAEGDEFMEAGIAHFRMVQVLAPIVDNQQRKLTSGIALDAAIRRFDTAEVSWTAGGKLIRSLRKSVYQASVETQLLPLKTLVQDELDENLIHFHSQFEGQTVGSVRMDLSGFVSRLVVDSAFRQQGIGTGLLEAAVAKAQRFGLKAVNIAADVQQEPFLKRSGFHLNASGDETLANARDESLTVDEREEGTVQRLFSRDLTDVETFQPSRSNLSGTAYDAQEQGYVLGEAKGFLLLRREEEFRRVIEAMCSQARSHIQIHSPLLDHKLFDSPGLYEICSALARRNKYTKIEILLYDSHRVIKNGHSLLEIARRLPSSIAMRIVHPELRSSNHEYVLADDSGLIYRQDAEQYEGYANFKDVTEANRLRRQFRSAWESGLQDPNLRQLKV